MSYHLAKRLAGHTLVVAVMAVPCGAWAASCDRPDTVGVEQPLYDGRGVSLVWAGSEYGMAWVRDGAPRSDVWFVRLDEDGVPLDEPVAVSEDGWSDLPSVVRTDEGWAVTWRTRAAGVESDVLFARLDPAGVRIGPIVEIASDPEVWSWPLLVWTGSEFAVGWSRGTDVTLTRLSPAGNVIDHTVVGLREGVVESLVWNGFEYAFAVYGGPEFLFLRTDAAGDPIGSWRVIADGNPNVRYIDHQRRASMVLNDTGYLVAINICPTSRREDCMLMTKRLTDEGIPGEATVVAEGGWSPALAWSGSEGGLAWNNGAALGTWFARIGSGGNRIGANLHATIGSVWYFGPRIAWNGSEYGITVEPQTGIGGVWFERVGCNCSDNDGDGTSTCEADCNDFDPTVYPGAVEHCDGIPNDCDDPDWPRLPDDEVDDDDDGFSACAGDCDDLDGERHPGATEVCNGSDDDCDGFVDEDADGRDSDADGIGNACDNCRFDPNLTQGDADADGEGDACDVDDGVIHVRFAEPGSVGWQEEAGFESWNVYRGDLAVLVAGGSYTQSPGSNPLAARTCDVMEPWLADSAIPEGGQVAFYLVTGNAGGHESDLGVDGSGAPRHSTDPCQVPD